MQTLPPFILAALARLQSEDDMPPDEYAALASMCLRELVAEVNRLRCKCGEEAISTNENHVVVG